MASLLDALLGQTAAPQGPIPLSSMVMNNPVGTQSLGGQSLTMPSPYFNPGSVIDGQPVMQTDIQDAQSQRAANTSTKAAARPAREVGIW